MSWRDAPVYVRAHDLCVGVVSRAPTGPVGERLVDESMALLLSVSEALSFPALRLDALATADRHVVALKVLLRLANATGVVDARGGTELGLRVVELGRMIGGWRRKKSIPPDRGDGLETEPTG